MKQLEIETVVIAYKREALRMILQREFGKLSSSEERLYATVLDLLWDRMTPSEQQEIDVWTRELVAD